MEKVDLVLLQTEEKMSVAEWKKGKEAMGTHVVVDEVDVLPVSEIVEGVVGLYLFRASLLESPLLVGRVSEDEEASKSVEDDQLGGVDGQVYQKRRDLSEAATANVKANSVLTNDESESVSGCVLASEDLGTDAVT